MLLRNIYNFLKYTMHSILKRWGLSRLEKSQFYGKYIYDNHRLDIFCMIFQITLQIRNNTNIKGTMGEISIAS